MADETSTDLSRAGAPSAAPVFMSGPSAARIFAASIGPRPVLNAEDGAGGGAADAGAGAGGEGGSAVVDTGAGAAADAGAGTVATGADAGSKTLIEGGDAGKTVTAPADWPEDWRVKLAGDDKAYLKTLERFGSPPEVAKALKAATARLSSGEMKSALPKDASPEQVAQWRTENGIPDKAEGYLDKLELPGGMVLGEADKPLVSTFAEAAHAANMTPAQVSGALAWYYAQQDAITAQQDASDATFKAGSEDALRAEWGPEFTPNINGIQNLLATAPEGVADKLLGGRLADGTRVGNHPDVLRWLNSLSREMNPAATLLPAGTATAAGLSDEIATIEKTMKTDQQAYWKDTALQARYRDLLDARERMTKRAA